MAHIRSLCGISLIWNRRPFLPCSRGTPAGPVLGLTTDAEGNLWIRPQSAGLVRYSAGVLHDVLPGLVPDETGVTAMCRGRNGEVLLARPNGDLRYHGGKLVPLAVTAQ